MLSKTTNIVSLNQIERDEWVRKMINQFFRSGVVLDVGAGTAPYKNDLNHLTYIAHDFGEYCGEKLGGTKAYAQIDVKSDITAIPLNSQSIDYILCTEVLEHVPKPLEAIEEMSRLLRKDGIILLTTPLTGAIHQEPYHYYGGFSPGFFDFAANAYDLEVVSLENHGGYLRFMAQELSRFNYIYNDICAAYDLDSRVPDLKEHLTTLARELFNLEPQIERWGGMGRFSLDKFSIGCWVILKKIR